MNIGNAPSVNVANTPSVSVANTPTVSLAGGASVKVTRALDGQGTPKPLAVLDAIQPYEDACSFGFGGGFNGGCNFHTVPSGKRLVIQEFDAEGNLEKGLKPIGILLTPSTFSHFSPVTFMGPYSGFNYFATHQETRLYVASNQTPNCTASLTANSPDGVYNCALSGFLVDVP